MDKWTEENVCWFVKNLPLPHKHGKQTKKALKEFEECRFNGAHFSSLSQDFFEALGFSVGQAKCLMKHLALYQNIPFETVMSTYRKDARERARKTAASDMCRDSDAVRIRRGSFPDVKTTAAASDAYTSAMNVFRHASRSEPWLPEEYSRRLLISILSDMNVKFQLGSEVRVGYGGSMDAAVYKEQYFPSCLIELKGTASEGESGLRQLCCYAAKKFSGDGTIPGLYLWLDTTDSMLKQRPLRQLVFGMQRANIVIEDGIMNVDTEDCTYHLILMDHAPGEILEDNLKTLAIMLAHCKDKPEFYELPNGTEDIDMFTPAGM